MGWLSGQGLVLTVALALLAGALVIAVMYRRRALFRREDAGSLCECGGSEEWRRSELDHVGDRNASGHSLRSAPTPEAAHTSREIVRFNREPSRGPKGERLHP